jgi:hypothetical protein
MLLLLRRLVGDFAIFCAAYKLRRTSDSWEEAQRTKMALIQEGARMRENWLPY